MSKVKTSVYLSSDLMVKLQEMAKKDNRSLNNLIESLLRKQING